MAITSIGSRGTLASSTNASTFSISPTANIAAGRCVILHVATRQPPGELSIGGTAGNDWVTLGTYSHQGGDNAHVKVFLCNVQNAITTADQITVDFGTSIADVCAAIWEYSVGAGKILAPAADPVETQVTSANGFGAASFSGLPSQQRLYFRSGAKRANSTATITATSGFTTHALNLRSRNNNASAIILRSEHRINTSAGETSNPTLSVSGNTASLFVALDEVDPPEASIVEGSTSGAWEVRAAAGASASGAWVVRNLADGSTVGSWTVRGFAEGVASGAWSVEQDVSIVEGAADGAWQVRNAVHGAADGAWSVRGFSAGSTDGAWDVSNFAQADAGGSWAVRNFSLSGTSGAWMVRNQASALQSGAWSVRGFAEGGAAGSWQVRNLSAAETFGAWVVRDFAQGSASGAWAVLEAGLVSGSASGAWAVRSFVAGSELGAWQVRSFADAGVSGAWSVLEMGFATGSTDGAWSVREYADGGVAGSWHIRGLVQSAADGAWSVRILESGEAAGSWQVMEYAEGGASGAWLLWAFSQGAADGAWSVDSDIPTIRPLDQVAVDSIRYREMARNIETGVAGASSNVILKIGQRSRYRGM